MRSMWLEKIDTDYIWDCLPRNPYSTKGGCFFANPSGLGYSQEITQNQIDVDYFIKSIKSKNQSVNVEAYFYGDEHLQNFVDFIGDFSKQLRLYYSPDGSIEPYDQVSKPFYKEVVISDFEKGEKTTAGWYVCKIRFTSQSDVWRKDYEYSQTTDYEQVGEPLLYPYEYSYEFGGQNTFVVNIDNKGRETGCLIEIINNSGEIIYNPEWYNEHIIIDRYGKENKELQRGKFLINLQNGTKLFVNSDPTKQESKIIADNDEENIVSLQEPSWDYINFVKIKNGTNRFVFSVSQSNVTIKIKYSELKEVV